jgi:hypothetical protein
MVKNDCAWRGEQIGLLRDGGGHNRKKPPVGKRKYVFDCIGGRREKNS